MQENEIEVPKEIREFMLARAQETVLGTQNNSKKQFRYGNLHIREYDNKFLVHVDNVDPRLDPFGHLLYDAPEVLVGIGCALLGKTKLGKRLLGIPIDSPFSSITSSVIFGYLGYAITKKIKEME